MANKTQKNSIVSNIKVWTCSSARQITVYLAPLLQHSAIFIGRASARVEYCALCRPATSADPDNTNGSLSAVVPSNYPAYWISLVAINICCTGKRSSKQNSFFSQQMISLYAIFGNNNLQIIRLIVFWFEFYSLRGMICLPRKLVKHLKIQIKKYIKQKSIQNLNKTVEK